jgi:hypothetical protein
MVSGFGGTSTGVLFSFYPRIVDVLKRIGVIENLLSIRALRAVSYISPKSFEDLCFGIYGAQGHQSGDFAWGNLCFVGAEWSR